MCNKYLNQNTKSKEESKESDNHNRHIRTQEKKKERSQQEISTFKLAVIFTTGFRF